MRTLGLAAVALVLATSVAGCLWWGDEPRADPCADPAKATTLECLGDDPPVQDSVRGVVVDQALNVLQAAKVSMTVDGKPRLLESDAKGAFLFTQVPPGVHFVQASKPGYSSAQSSVEVVAGQASRSVVIRLEADPDNLPYHVPYEFNGYFECSVAARSVGVGAAACSMPNNKCVPPVGACAYNTGNLTQDRFGVFYTLDKRPTWVQSEMVWTASQQAGSSLQLLHSWLCSTNGGFPCDFDAAGTSPLALQSGAEEIREAGWGDNGTQLFVRAFASDTDQVPSPVGSAGVTFQQPFTIYTHVFYGYQPPADWRFSGQSKVPGPK